MRVGSENGGWQVLHTWAADMPLEITTRRLDTLSDYLFDEDSQPQVLTPWWWCRVRFLFRWQEALRAARKFDGLDFIFADGDVELAPWHPRARPLLLLARMSVVR